MSLIFYCFFIENCFYSNNRIGCTKCKKFYLIYDMFYDIMVYDMFYDIFSFLSLESEFGCLSEKVHFR